MRFGLNGDIAGYTHRNLQLTEHLGCDTVRIPVGWNRCGDPAVTDVIQRARAADLRPLICLWFHESEIPSRELYADSCAAFAHLYPNVFTWQLLNEPNATPYGSLSARDAADYVQAATVAIRAVNSQARIIAPAPSPGVKGHRAWNRWLHDYLPPHLQLPPSIHLYPTGPAPMRVVRENLDAANDISNQPIYVTEAGILHNLYYNEQPALTAQLMAESKKARVHTLIYHCTIMGDNPDEWHRKAKLNVLERPRLYDTLKKTRSSLNP